MEIKFSKNRIEFEKELNSLDRFVIDFVSVLDKCSIKYVIVSGYVSILFGRSRMSEDIDIIIEKFEREKFRKLWKEAGAGFDSIIENDEEKAYDEYLNTGHSLRFARKGMFIPNIELKFPKTDLDFWTLKERRTIVLNNHRIFIGPLELQIPFKLFLGSEKDIEDARHLFKIFKDKLNLSVLEQFNRKLKVTKQFKEYLK